MADAKILTLTTEDGDPIAPRTAASAVVTASGESVQAALNRMDQSDGELTSPLVAMSAPDNSTPQIRNIVVVEAETDVSTLGVPAGTIILVKKQ